MPENKYFLASNKKSQKFLINCQKKFKNYFRTNLEHKN